MKGLIKLLVLLVIAGGLYWYYSHSKTEEERHEQAVNISKRVFPFGDEADRAVQLESVAEVRLTPSGSSEEIIALRVGGDAWRIAAPVSTEADNSAVTSFARALVALELRDTPENSVVPRVASADLYHYGLDEPQITVGLRYEGQDSVRRIMIGDSDPSNQHRYALVEGTSDVLVIADRFAMLNKTLFDLRNKEMFDITPDNALAITLENASGEVAMRLARETLDDPWFLTEPAHDEADEQQVRALVSQLRSARATNFLTDTATLDELRVFDLASPEWTLTLVTANGASATTQQQVALGTLADETRIMGTVASAPIVTLPESSFAKLLEPPDGFRNRRMATLTDVEEITYETPDVTFTLSPLASPEGDVEWAVSDPPLDWSDELAAPFIHDMVVSLRALNAQAIFLDEYNAEEAGMEPPAVRLTISDGDHEEPTMLEIGEVIMHEGRPGRAIHREGREAVLFLDNMRANQLLIDLDTVCEPASEEMTAEVVSPEV